MTPDFIFQLASQIALPGWLLLMFASNWKWTSRIVVGFIIVALAATYAFLVLPMFSPEMFSSFGTLEGVMNLFTDPTAVLVGWIHYLAFDLMVGWFIVFDAQREGINRWFLIPCLLFTFMLGPVGFLMYLLLRLVIRKKYFVDFK